MRLKFEESIMATIVILTSFLIIGLPSNVLVDLIIGSVVLWIMAYYILSIDVGKSE